MRKKKSKSLYDFSHPAYIRKNINISFKSIDSDRDGVPDYKDCAKLNPRKHSISITMEERIKKLPIVVSSKDLGTLMQYYNPEREFSMTSPKKLPHVLSSRAKQEAPEARQMFLSAAKKYPSIIGEIERTKPPVIVVTSKAISKTTTKSGWVHLVTGDVYVVLGAPSTTARRIFHELTHKRQLKTRTPEDIIEEYERYPPKKYYETPMEKEAVKVSKQEMKKYYKGRKPSGRRTSKLFDMY